MDELQSLQNAAQKAQLLIFEDKSMDKRKTIKKYYATTIGLAVISPALDYEQLNHFILGFIKAIQLYKIDVTK
jgi:hypothetical protein